MLLFWTSCVLPHGFQIQSGYLACTLSCLHAVILKVTSGVTPAFSTNRGVHCINMYTAWQPVMFPTCHVCNRGRLPGFDRETSRTVSRRALHSAAATALGCLSLFLIPRLLQCRALLMYFGYDGTEKKFSHNVSNLINSSEVLVFKNTLTKLHKYKS